LAHHEVVGGVLAVQGDELVQLGEVFWTRLLIRSMRKLVVFNV
jgi:hypothetical protein